MEVSITAWIAVVIGVIVVIIGLLEKLGIIFFFGRIINSIKRFRDLLEKGKRIIEEEEKIQKEKQMIKDLIEIKDQDLKGYKNKLCLKAGHTGLNVSGKAPYIEQTFYIANFSIFDFTMEKAECIAKYVDSEIGKDQIVKTTKVSRQSNTYIQFKIQLPPGVVEDLRKNKEKWDKEGGHDIHFKFSVYGEFEGHPSIESFEKQFDEERIDIPSYDVYF